MSKNFKKHRVIKIVSISLVSLIAISVTSFLIWTSDYYHADEVAQDFYKKDKTIKKSGDLYFLPRENSSRGFIFYPGAKVEAIAYLPILEKIRDECNINCVLVEMPLNLAFFDQNAASVAMDEYQQITDWYIGGHSLGGAISSQYASNHQNKVAGLILMGAYIYGNYPSKKALTIYGSLNSDLEKNITYSDNIIKIEGGNHAQFGNYGKQKGDLDAKITNEEQQSIAVDAIDKFINS